MKMLLSYDIANLQGIGRREYQQDSFGFVNALDISRIMEEGMLAAVADGMGGMQGGKDASTLVMKTLMSDFEKMDKESNLGIQLAQSILHAGSLVQMMIERGEITPEKARTYPGKNLITRAIGTEPVVECDIFHKKMERGDSMLLCSDGLSNLLDDQEILFEVVHGINKQHCCQRLLDIAKNRGAPDNVPCSPWRDWVLCWFCPPIGSAACFCCWLLP